MILSGREVCENLWTPFVFLVSQDQIIVLRQNQFQICRGIRNIQNFTADWDIRSYLLIFFFILIYQTEEHHVSLLGNLELSQNQQTILTKQGLTNTMNFLDNLIK